MTTARRLRALLCVAFAVAQPSPEAQRRVDSATESERAAVALQPRSAEAYRNLAEAYKQHKFLRAASEALTHAVTLEPSASAHLDLGVLLRRVGEPENAKWHLEASLRLQPSATGHIHLSMLAEEPAERVRAVEAALALEPRNAEAYSRLALLHQQQRRSAEAEAALRALTALNPAVGGQKLYEHLRFAERKLEAAVEFRRARIRADAAAADGAPQGASASRLDEWSRFVDAAISPAAVNAKPKCLTRRCIEGLEEALERIDADAPAGSGGGGSAANELPYAELSATAIQSLLGSPIPTVLRSAAIDWGPITKWDAEHLLSSAGEEELEVTVVTMEGSFEVRSDRIERPPKSVMRLRDFVRLLAAKVDANLTIYSRQAPLWPMAGLLADLDPPRPWMEVLRLIDLNFWLGDGHFRNTLHFDPHDNFLCQVRGSKYVLLYPPDAKPHLYYGHRKDIQAHYLPTRGEYGRHDTGIVSENTAEINGANPDLTKYPKFEHARKLQSVARLGPSDCLYLPNGWHHHVFSEADGTAGYNLAINLWIDRAATLSGIPPRPDYKKEKHPTIKQVGRAMREVEPERRPPPYSTAEEEAPSTSQGECTVSDG